MSDLNELFKVVSEGKKHYEENDPKGKILKETKEHVKEDLSALFASLTSLKEELEVELVEAVAQKEEIIKEEVPLPVIKTPEERKAETQDTVDKYLTGKSFQQPDPEIVDKNIEAIRTKIKFLEQAIGKIAATGPGGGEVNFRYLDDVNRSSIDKDRYLSYDPNTKKFLFLDTRVSIEAFDRTASIPLLATPQLLKPDSFTNSKNLTYDPETGVFTFLTQCEVTLALSVNALASSAGQRVYQYAERNTGSGWVPIQNSGKNFQLTNGQHTQIVNAQTISRLAGEQIRYFIYASEAGKVNLITETLPNITGSTVYIPAIRIQYTGR